MKSIIFIVFFLSIYISGFAQNQDVSGGAIWESEPYMAVDPVNPQHIVVAWMGYFAPGQLSIKTKVTINGGSTWSAAVAIPHVSPAYTDADVSMSFDHTGNLFMSYIDHSQSDNDSGGVYVVMSADGGLTWNTPSSVITGAADPLKCPLDRPWLSIGKATGAAPDTLYVTTKPAPWIPAPNRPYFMKSYDNGATWSTYKYIDSASYSVGNLIKQPMAAPTSDSAGVFHCIYPTYIPSVSVYPRYIMASHTGAGVSFTYSVVSTIVGAGTIDTLAKAGYRFICDPANNKHYAFFTIQNFYGDLDVFCMETFNGGATWGARVRVNDDLVGNHKMQDLVWANFDEHGDIIAAWRDRRDAPDSGYAEPSEIWGAVKWLDSASFSANFKISDTIVAYDSVYLAAKGNDFMNVAMAQDTMSAVWGDVRTGALNIWFERRNMHTGTTSIRNIVHEEIPVANLYPNPAHDAITIEGKDITQIILYDMTGKQVLQQKIHATKSTLKIAQLAAGTYMATIYTANGNLVKKVVLE